MQNPVYIAILRGINVSGSKMIKMPALKKALEDGGFDHVKTYIQSGNILFTHQSTKTSELEKTISGIIRAVFGFEVPALVFDKKYLAKIQKNNPFILKRNEDIIKLYVTFLSDYPEAGRLDALDAAKYLPEEFSMGEKAIYFSSPEGYGNAKMNNNFFENKLKVSATTRNWKTVNELLRLAEEMES